MTEHRFAFRRRHGLAGIGLLIAIALMTACAGPATAPASPGTPASVAGPQITVTLKDFAIDPKALRLPAGVPVTLVIRNVGQVPHEFMVGRDVHGDGFETDLFADVAVQTGADGEQDQVRAGSDPHGTTGDGHEGDDHGTMVLVQPGQTAYMTFTLPTDRAGKWSSGCFLAGHYQLGMRGQVVVEAKA